MIKHYTYVRDSQIWPTAWSNSKRQIHDWRLRLCHEHNLSTATFFITLTLNDESMACHGTPDKGILTKFIKRFRMRCTRSGLITHGLKYWYVSEYGERTHRLHYHMLLYTYNYVSYFSFKDMVAKCWPYGFVDCQLLHGTKGVTYVSKYVNKKFFESSAKSQSAGIGLSWLRSNMSNFVAQLDAGQYPVLFNGKYRTSLPRYYVKKIVEAYPRLKSVFEQLSIESLRNKLQRVYCNMPDELFKMSRRAYNYLVTVVERLYFNLVKLHVVSTSVDNDVGAVLYVSVPAVVASYLHRQIYQDRMIELHRNGGINFKELTLRI